MRFIKSFTFIVLFFCGTAVLAQYNYDKTDSSGILLLDLGVQIECNDAIDDMYNFDFDYAERQFKWLRQKYAWHPLPSFLMGLSQWWKIMPNMNNESHDRAFLALMDSSLEKAKYIYEEVNEIEGAFFLSCTYGFKGRLYSERKEYRKAATAGRKALRYLKICRGNEAFSPEILFGDALFNYYAEWIPDNYPMLRPIMALFPNGDLKLGLQQLKEVTRNAFYTRTEAMYFLMRILSTEEKDYYGALEIVKRLCESYPNNSYFHRYYARLLYQLGRFSQSETESLSILDRIDSSYVGYEENSGRYASFFLGQIYSSRNETDKAIMYYQQCVDFGRKAEAESGGYHRNSLFYLGRIYEKKKEYETALEYYNETKKVTNRSDKLNKQARYRIDTCKKKIKERDKG